MFRPETLNYALEGYCHIAQSFPFLTSHLEKATSPICRRTSENPHETYEEYMQRLQRMNRRPHMDHSPFPPTFLLVRHPADEHVAADGSLRPPPTPLRLGVARSQINHSRILPTPLPVGVTPPSADRSKNGHQDIEKVIEQAMKKAASARQPIQCQWGECGETVSTEPNALRKHMQDMHGVLEGGQVSCLWAGCSSKIKTSSLVQHLTSTKHLGLGIRCPLCDKGLARKDALRRHLSGTGKCQD
ncbi:hypothetical protein K438DRAFT_1959005 [Mycena galopus ATCC 62051]|nr:hypothetical protein K438DRAFT_1959005 [Mycena galopus ATCC 62051]